MNTVLQKTRSFVAAPAAKVASVLAIGAAAASSAHAELPAAVSTAITGYQTDATTAIGLIMAAGVVIWGLMKLATKLGWR